MEEKLKSSQKINISFRVATTSTQTTRNRNPFLTGSGGVGGRGGGRAPHIQEGVQPPREEVEVVGVGEGGGGGGGQGRGDVHVEEVGD